MTIDESTINQKCDVRRLAKGLSRKLRLPTDDSLAYVIGDGTECTSESAVASWLRANGFSGGSTTFADACDALERALYEALGEA